MARQLSRNVWTVIALLAASVLISLRDLLNPFALPPQALAWTAFVAVAYLVVAPLAWKGHRAAFIAAGLVAAANVAATSLNPVDPYYLTHWFNPLESLLVLLEGYVLPLPLIFFAYQAYRERRQAKS